jgi:hypothetical protein
VLQKLFPHFSITASLVSDLNIVSIFKRICPVVRSFRRVCSQMKELTLLPASRPSTAGLASVLAPGPAETRSQVAPTVQVRRPCRRNASSAIETSFFSASSVQNDELEGRYHNSSSLMPFLSHISGQKRTGFHAKIKQDQYISFMNYS